MAGQNQEGLFYAFMPLSNWLSGFDRYALRYDKALRPSRYPDRFYMLSAAEGFEAGICKARDLARRLGEPGGEVAWIESALPMGEGAMEPNRWTGTGVGWGWPGSSVPIRRVGLAGESGELRECPHEELTARAYKAARAGGALDWTRLRPRSFSVLPIALACQARCAFCFSKASASEAAKQKPMDLDGAKAWAVAAAKAGASRAVITGGGEPTLMKPHDLERLCEALSKTVGQTLLITNAVAWSKLGELELSERMEGLAKAGLARIAISRHAPDREGEKLIMGASADGERVARAARAAGMATRTICVLQKGGVDSEAKVVEYVEAMAFQGISEVCFKELYVSSVSENRWAMSRENQYGLVNRVGLDVVGRALARMDFEVSSHLPWGSPLWRGRTKGVEMSVAAYTEPSVGWELAHRQARSWNLMADGSCLASLEDGGSALNMEDWT